MKPWTVLISVAAIAVLMSCTASTRYEVLSFFFDGVPPPEVARAPEEEAAAAAASIPERRRIRYREHGPFAAKMCNGCHVPGASNMLVAPGGELCFRCHQLALDKKYVHGPLVSGGCTVCHDPHSSQYRYLLVSASDSFCFHCHDRAAIVRTHAAGTEDRCTTCHDAHTADNKYLLR